MQNTIQELKVKLDIQMPKCDMLIASVYEAGIGMYWVVLFNPNLPPEVEYSLSCKLPTEAIDFIRNGILDCSIIEYSQSEDVILSLIPLYSNPKLLQVFIC